MRAHKRTHTKKAFLKNECNYRTKWGASHPETSKFPECMKFGLTSIWIWFLLHAATSVGRKNRSRNLEKQFIVGTRIRVLFVDVQQESCEKKTEWMCTISRLSVFFCIIPAFPLCFPQIHTLLFLRGVERSRAQRGGHTATFLSVLCWLGWTLPLRGWWGGMALWRNQPSASIVVIILWIQDCWICSFGPLRRWEMTCLCSPDTLSVYSKTTHPPAWATQPSSTLSARATELFFNVKTGAGPALNLRLYFSSMPVLIIEPIFPKTGERQVLRRWKNSSLTEHIITLDKGKEWLCFVIFWFMYLYNFPDMYSNLHLMYSESKSPAIISNCLQLLLLTGEKQNVSEDTYVLQP